jgi:hypothetical protein
LLHDHHDHHHHDDDDDDVSEPKLEKKRGTRRRVREGGREVGEVGTWRARRGFFVFFSLEMASSSR